MGRILVAAALWMCLCVGAGAQGLTALARIDPENSAVRDGWLGGTRIDLTLSQGVPYRVFTLDTPPRLVLDFAELDWTGLTAAQLLPEPGRIQALRFGAFRPGWSRLVLDLAEPMLPDSVDLQGADSGGPVRLRIALKSADAGEFARASGVPDGAGWAPAPSDPATAPEKTEGRFVVVLDPGHGGIDPGAERGGLVEKTLALDFARELRDMLRREGVAVVMTRDADVFVSLEARTALAHQVGAALFMSIHADALSQGGAHGATVYTLSDEASDAASALLAARHDRSDILAGVNLTGADDEVTSVLLDIARQETEPRSAALAQAVIAGMDRAGGPMNRKPWRKAGFSVLKSADIPSVLVEIGFLSSERDRKNLADPVWRSVIAAGLADAVLDWRDTDAARAALVRQ